MSYGFGYLNSLAERCHDYAKRQGFWDGQLPPPMAVTVALSKLMLVTTEVAEAAEAVRKHDAENLAEELADICIRVFDFAEACGFNLEQAIVDKMARNEERPRMHGKLA